MKFYKAEEYQGLCEELFLKYQVQIKALLPDAVIEHIGASSIPGAASKGDLDILIRVSGNELESAIALLTTLGFSEKNDTLRTSELCMLESSYNEDVAFQVIAIGSEFECFLEFRDKLRKNSALLEQYNQLKMSCVGWSEDKYRLKKSTFVEHVLALT
jgi:GrpB-like predicted nucleotidyltransferase (UPF0157 family)